MSEPRLNELYSKLKENGLVSVDFEKFNNYYSQPEKKQVLYGKLKENGLVSVDFDKFDSHWFGTTATESKPAETPKEPFSWFDNIINAAGNIPRGAIDMVSRSVRTIPTIAIPSNTPGVPMVATKPGGEGYQQQQAAATDVIRNRMQGGTDSFLEAARSIDAVNNDAFPANEQYDQTTLGELGTGIGGVLGLVVPGTGFLATAAEQQDDAIASNATPEQVATATGIGFASGGLEYLPVASFFKRIDRGTGGLFSKKIAGKLKSGGIGEWIAGTLAGGLEEGLQEVVQNGVKNLTARELYDSSRELSEGGLASFEGGAGVGLVLNALGLGLRRITPKSRQEAAELNEARKFVNEMDDTIPLTEEDPAGTVRLLPAAQDADILKAKKTELENSLLSEEIPENRAKINREIASIDYRLWTPTPGQMNTVRNPETGKLEVYAEDGKQLTRGKRYNATVDAFIAKEREAWKADTENRVDYNWTEADGTFTGSAHAETASKVGENPEELLDLIVQEQEAGSAIDAGEGRQTAQEIAIANNLGSISTEEFARVFDRNLLKGNLHLVKNWIRKRQIKEGASSLEALLDNPEENYGVEITPQDVLDFIQKYRSGDHFWKETTGSEHIGALQERFQELTGYDKKDLSRALSQKKAEIEQQKAEQALKDAEAQAADPDDIINQANIQEQQKIAGEQVFERVKATAKTMPLEQLQNATDTKGNPLLTPDQATKLSWQAFFDLGLTYAKNGAFFSITDKDGNVVADGLTQQQLRDKVIEAIGGMDRVQGFYADAVANAFAKGDLQPELFEMIQGLESGTRAGLPVVATPIGMSTTGNAQQAGSPPVPPVPPNSGGGNATGGNGGMIPISLFTQPPGKMDRGYLNIDRSWKGRAKAKAKDLFTWAGGLGKDLRKLYDKFGYERSAEVREAGNVAEDLRNAVIDHYKKNILDAWMNKARLFVGANARKDLIPKVDGTIDNTIGRKELMDRFTSWLPQQKRNAMERMLKAKVTDPAFQTRFDKLFGMYLQGKKIPKTMAEVFDEYIFEESEVQQLTNVGEAINQVLEGRRNLKDLPANLQQPVRAMKMQIARLGVQMKKAGVFPGEMKPLLDKRGGTYITRSYRIFEEGQGWIDRIPAHIRNAAVDMVYNQNKATNPNYTRNDAEFYVKNYLQDKVDKAGNEPIKTGRRLGSKDLSITMEREDIPPEFRALMGEYRDPSVNYMKSVARMANLLSMHKFLVQARRQFDGTLFWTAANAPVGAVEIATTKSEAMGALRGIYTYPEIAKAFEEGIESQNELLNSKYVGWMIRLASTVKMSKTVLNPATHPRNVIGGMAMVMASGHNVLSPTEWKSVMNTLSKDRQAMDELTRLGVLDDSVTAGEIKQWLKDNNYDALLGNDYLSLYEKGERLTKGLAQKAANMYQLEDNAMRIFLYQKELSAYVAAKEKGKGMPLTAKELQAEKEAAAERVRNQYPTYSRVSKAVQWLRFNPFVGTFVVFHAESARTSKNIMKQAWVEMKDPNPAIKALGVKRYAGLSAAVTLPASLALTSQMMNNISDEDEENFRLFVPEWSKFSPLVYIGTDNEGKMRYLDVNYANPYQVLTGPAYKMLFNPGLTTEEYVAETVKGILEPFFSPEISFKAMVEAGTNRKSNGQQIANPADDITNQVMKRVDHVFQMMAPGFFTAGSRIYLASQGYVNGYGREYKTEDELLALLGNRVSTIDVEASLRFNAYRLRDDMHNAKRLYNSAKGDQGTKGEDSDYVTGRYEQANASYQKYQETMIRTIEGAFVLGMQPYEIRKLLSGKESVGFSEKQVKNWMNGITMDLNE